MMTLQRLLFILSDSVDNLEMMVSNVAACRKCSSSDGFRRERPTQ